MPEPDEARPFFTRRRVVTAVAMVAGVLVIALAWLCVDVWRVERRSPWQIAVTGFEMAPGGTSMVAVMTFTNQSCRTFSLHEVGTNGVCWARFFGESWPKVFDEWSPSPWPKHGNRDIPPGAGWRFIVELPQDGRKGRVGLLLSERVSSTKRLRARLAELLTRKKGPKAEWMMVQAEFIQCPRVEPGGTSEPGRILPK